MRSFEVLLAGLLLTAVSFSGARALDLTGFVDLALGQATYPPDNALYDSREQQSAGGAFRLLAETGENVFHFSANLLESVATLPPLSDELLLQLPRETERSALLTWEQHDNGESRVALSADVLQFQRRGRRLDLTLGRQPISLATTFYFVPNDFFAPFAAQTFFRTYKPGVDAFRADLRLAELSQLTLLGVLAYERDEASSNGWRRAPDWSKTALLARYTREWGGFGWGLLGGTVHDRSVIGGSLQGQLFDWLGVRGEGHYAWGEKGDVKDGGGVALGIEHNYANNASWRLEYFYNGYRDGVVTGYAGRNYLALGMGWEFNPLLTGSLVGLAGLDDSSQLLAAYLLYSLTNESELALTGSLPHGDKPAGQEAGSEFGRQPLQLLLEYRLYF